VTGPASYELRTRLMLEQQRQAKSYLEQAADRRRAASRCFQADLMRLVFEGDSEEKDFYLRAIDRVGGAL
jgi:hypothetical protein